MKTKIILKYSGLFFLILFIITFIFSYSFNSNMLSHINKGLLESTTVVQKKDYNKEFSYKGVVMESFDSYSEAMSEPKFSTLLYANDGVVYNRKTPIGTQTFVIAFSWINGNDFDAEGMKNYVNDNFLLMILRTIYLSNAWMYMFIIYIILLLIYKAVIPPFIFIGISIFSFVKYKTLPKNILEKQAKNLELYRSLILTSSFNRLSKNTSFLYLSMFYTYMSVYLVYLNNSLYFFETYLPIILSTYVGIVLIHCIYTVSKVLLDKEVLKIQKEIEYNLDNNHK